MKLEAIVGLLDELHQAKVSEELLWELTGNTRHKTNWNGQEIIIDRRNNVDKDTQEIHFKVGDFEVGFLPKTKGFKLLEIFQNKI